MPGEISGDPVMGAIPIYTQSIDSNDVTGIPKHNVPKNRKLFGGNSNVFSLHPEKLGSMIQFDEDILQMGGENHHLEGYLDVLFEKKVSLEFYRCS